MYIKFPAPATVDDFSKALTLYTSSTSKALRHEAIELSTYGIIFLGTPDQITDAADFSQVLLRICSFYSPTNDVIAEHSIRNSEILVQYNSIGERFDTKFFFEGVPTRLPGGEQQMVSRAVVSKTQISNLTLSWFRNLFQSFPGKLMPK